MVHSPLSREAFRPDADGDAVAGLRHGGAGHDLKRHRREAGRCDGDGASRDRRHFGGDEVHARRTEKAGDEAVGRAVVELERRADLLDLPSLRTTILLAIVMASVWSCVT